MAATGSNLLTGYDLKTAIGPIVGIGGVGFIDNCLNRPDDPCLSTSMGLLSFTSNIDLDGEGTFTATVQQVPAPAPLLLLSGGLAAAFARQMRRKRT
jgi:hypothetical protein